VGVPDDVSGGDSLGLFGRYAGYWGAGRGTRRRRGEEEDHHPCDRLGQRREGVKSEQECGEREEQSGRPIGSGYHLATADDIEQRREQHRPEEIAHGEWQQPHPMTEARPILSAFSMSVGRMPCAFSSRTRDDAGRPL
jgi:hypothetical protein